MVDLALSRSHSLLFSSLSPVSPAIRLSGRFSFLVGSLLAMSVITLSTPVSRLQRHVQRQIIRPNAQRAASHLLCSRFLSPSSFPCQSHAGPLPRTSECSGRIAKGAKNISSAVFGDKEGGLHTSTPPLSGFTFFSAPVLAIRLYILRSKETTRLSALASTTRALSCVYKVTAHQQP
jgi:hypothetical protein